MHRIKTEIPVFQNSHPDMGGWQAYLNIACYLFVILLLYVSSVQFFPSVSASASVAHSLKSSEIKCLQSAVKYADIFDTASSCDAEEAVYDFEEEFELRCEYCISVLTVAGLVNIPSSNHFTKQNSQSNNTFVLLRKSIILQV